MGERLFTHAGSTYKVFLCWDYLSNKAVNGSVLITVYRGDQLAAQSTVPLGVDGDVRRIDFDSANYALSEKTPVFPIVVDARWRGTTFDQYTTDLWLFLLDGKDLKTILMENVTSDRWGTYCEPDCEDSTKTQTIVIIAPEKSAQGLHDLKLRTRGKTTPYGKPDSASKSFDETARYIFNGQRYEMVPRQ